ncbi:DUF1330 domain-containing protein [Rhodosalinus halophilus]|uniref:DUF1330 domain-containing protein n=1 Tax=Rhodosalinus halophilus TaxID=2259333 RepID=A0A365UC77_9RHOB|nr:DUF1330 domain-containing protein [Rhodosalinus halophilus]RBI87020.1 DUF1330 domain-containing protein [Rhodosalinus halophilus]
MPKGYWIAQMQVTDPQAYERYRAANAEAFEKYGARFLVRGGAQQTREGGWKPRSVVLEFPSLEAAQACYDSPEYQRAKALREGAAEADLVIVEGYEG